MALFDIGNTSMGALQKFKLCFQTDPVHIGSNKNYINRNCGAHSLGVPRLPLL